MLLTSIFIRDIAMIFLAGILLPLICIQKLFGGDFAAFGLSFRKWQVFLPLNLVLGALLLLMFISEVPPPHGFVIDGQALSIAAYVMVAGIFEVVFFYAFLRTLFERAFGIIPGIIITAMFYALHHAGFQPEFGKLTLVGILYAATYRSGNSMLLIYPFFWGVGGCYDVLIQSQEVDLPLFSAVRSLCLLALLSGSAVFWARTKNTLKHAQRLNHTGIRHPQDG